MVLGETLANLRKAKGLSQEQLAEKLNLTRQTISKWELNQSTPDIDYLLKLSEVFGVSTDYLIKGEERTNTADRGSKPYAADEHDNGANNVNAYKWCFYLGAIVIGVSLIGIIAFVICSALNPITAAVNGTVFKGVLGFLFGTKTLWLFVVLVVLFAVGCLLSALGITKNMRLQKCAKIQNAKADGD